MWQVPPVVCSASAYSSNINEGCLYSISLVEKAVPERSINKVATKRRASNKRTISPPRTEGSASRAETIGQQLEYLYPRVFNYRGLLPRWPPDVFCLCASLLHRSGAYSVVVADDQPHLEGKSSVYRAKELRRIGELWRQACPDGAGLPPELHRWWKTVKANRHLALLDLSSNSECCVAILNLLGAADAASHSIGIYSFSSSKTHCPYTRIADFKLHDSRLAETVGVSLCDRIHPSKARVLPKMHTPQNGLTIRNLSHNLAYCQDPGVRPVWWNAAEQDSPHTLNLLLVPWPAEVRPNQFQSASRNLLPDRLEPKHYGMFSYIPGSGPSPELIKQLIETAESTVGSVDGVVLPELAMTEEEFDELSKAIVNSSRFLISGVSTSGEKGGCGQNKALWDTPIRFGKVVLVGRYKQGKHHRWKITKPQIVQYGIGASLHPEANWWESISIGPRSIGFASLRRWLTMSVLICEDLARPDPVGDILRAVGPNLIIALLADGPQISSRWPGRYAAALADDPGSSVLTLTSAGMSRLSKGTPGAPDRSGVIALWRDPLTGVRELELRSNEKALLLNLTVRYEREWTADGREDNAWSGYPILAGFHAITK